MPAIDAQAPAKAAVYDPREPRKPEERPFTATSEQHQSAGTWTRRILLVQKRERCKEDLCRGIPERQVTRIALHSRFAFVLKMNFTIQPNNACGGAVRIEAALIASEIEDTVRSAKRPQYLVHQDGRGVRAKRRRICGRLIGYSLSNQQRPRKSNGRR